MPKGSPELTRARIDEIIDACEELYQEHSFKDITVDMIAKRTTFTRASIYNYFPEPCTHFVLRIQSLRSSMRESVGENLLFHYS